MKAAVFSEAGPARDVLRVTDIDQPTPGPGEVLVRVHASGVNPIDYKIMQRGGALKEHPFAVTNFDGAGVIEAVGGGVDASRVGQRVWVYSKDRFRQYNTAAEYCITPAAEALPLPENVGFDEGACIGVPVITAHHGLFVFGPIEGMTVLVTGGAGGVGVYGVQVAKWGGARVLTTVSGPEKAEMASDAGADEVINYEEEDVVERVMELTDGEGVDFIFDVDFGGNLDVDAQIIKRHGYMTAYGAIATRKPVFPFDAIYTKNIMIHLSSAFFIKPEETAHALKDINTMLESGALKHYITRRYPLDKIVTAHEVMENGDFPGGKIIVEIA